ncbi:MAG: hypothetical protein KatS3mg103_0468 [Phycisphaerales bacterium]|nr:MAG: hypothetical protein KatS3mg103_0468 [Phycisphaerales bacterium]
MALQAGFTVGAHLDRARPTIGQRWATLALVLAALVLLWWLPDGPIQALGGKMGWEVVYRLFMAAYGLFFPAYVLYAVVPWALGMGPLPRSGRLVAAGTVAAVLPMVAAGFLADQEQWLPLALGLLLAGAAVTFVQRRRHAADSGTATAATEHGRDGPDPVEAPSPPGAHADG